MASVLFLFVPYVLHFLPRWANYFPISLLFAIAFIFDTLRVTWTGHRPVERILRITLFQGIP